MRRWLSNHLQRHMIRPIIYKASSRLAYTLTVALIWDRFINRSPVGLSTCFVLLGMVFLIGAWVARLRTDGYSLPRLPAKRLRHKNKPDIFYGDMIDYVDEPVINFEDLDTEEQDTCLIVTDLICAVIYLAASFFV